MEEVENHDEILSTSSTTSCSPSDSPEREESPIEDPWHSRVLDVHRWSDHPEIIRVVTQVWDTHFQHLQEEGRSGPKPKQDFRHQLRVLVLDLYVAWLEDPTLSIAVSMSANDWKTWSRYNALNISKKILQLIHGLADAGMIDVARGSYSGREAWWNRTTRVRAAEPLVTLFRGAKATRDDIPQIEGQECIVLKAGDGDKAKLTEYEDTPETVKMRRELEAYNALLADTFIDIPTLEEPWTTRLDERGKEVRVLIDHHHQFVRRIFSRGEWGCNGRFYGPWWQQISKELRSQIFINDTPTVEVDFKGLHVAILSAQKGVEVEGDPYALHEGLVPGAPPPLQRQIAKKLILTAFNARSKKAAFGSFREGFPTGHMAKGLTNSSLDDLLAAFTERHPHLAEFLFADHGIRLMNIDSKIAEFVHRWFTRRGVPVLSIHDSFIIDYTRVEELKRVMGIASRIAVGRALAVEANGAGLDRFSSAEERAVMLDFQSWREAPRGDGYRNRLKRWEERKAREVVPYGRVEG
ncbi:MAG: hypothetical protein J0L76_04800 [Rhodobacterales bacterium]|nr:hypothetical protein [Rhodobacterales bacterium]